MVVGLDGMNVTGKRWRLYCRFYAIYDGSKGDSTIQLCCIRTSGGNEHSGESGDGEEGRESEGAG